MDTLYKVQFACFIYMLMCTMLIGMTRLHIKWVNKKYEESRWMLCVAMFIMTLHFFFQMHYGIRASDTEMGAVFNILFYLPCFVLIAAAVYNLAAMERNKLMRFFIRQYSAVCHYSCSLRCVSFDLWHQQYGPMDKCDGGIV